MVESMTAKSRTQRPTMPPIKRMGRNTATSERLMESTVKPTSFAPSNAASTGAHSLFEIARDVFNDHDGIVHHEASRNRQRHQRKIVHAVAEEIHHAKRADQRHRHDDGGNQGRAWVAQKKKDDQDDQTDGDGECALNFPN